MEEFMASRMFRLKGEFAFVILQKAKMLEREGYDVIHFEIGEPDFDTPEHIKEAAAKALKEGYTHYTPSPGILELREAISEYLEEEFKVEYSPDEIIATPGGKAAIFYALTTVVEEGDEVIIPDPAFPAYESVIRFLNAKPVFVRLKEENDFRMIPEDVEAKVTDKTKAVVINSPHNPCGSVLTRSDVEGLAEIALRHNLVLITDDVYHKIIYDGFEHESVVSIPEVRDRVLLLNSLSKTYAMTGWRIGYIAADRRFIERMVVLQNNLVSCLPAFVQKATVAALRGPQDFVKKMVDEYRRRRDVIVDGLNRIRGFKCKKPLGAFYVFPNIKGVGMDERELVEYLLREAKVATLHGSAFGPGGEGYLRFSYATSIDLIKAGLERIKVAIEKLQEAG
ncbi:MAG: aspartate aminotransferase [Candidatus Bathyarchaeota archaeon B24]|nr:MAG: aspartate aminotransferase [Candidatus Bathyarchaeota archaeon B24]RLI25016.1 MAG: pyridoxal phosphate-dependent aminotransferase [Candidatus Bathyarchaeota archaeon]